VEQTKTRKKRPKIKKEKSLMGVQQNLIHCNKDTLSILEYLCYESNNVHNCAVYYARQIWFKSSKLVTSFDLIKALGNNKHFSALPSEVAVQTCMSVGESIRSFERIA
jgi:hypothetical protein